MCSMLAASPRGDHVPPDASEPNVPSTPLSRIVERLIRWRWPLLVAAILATAAAWPLSRQLSFDQSIESLYAEADPHLRDFRFSRRQFGGDEFLFVAYAET